MTKGLKTIEDVRAKDPVPELFSMMIRQSLELAKKIKDRHLSIEYCAYNDVIELTEMIDFIDVAKKESSVDPIEDRPHCPSCGSAAVRYLLSMGGWFCDKCDHRWPSKANKEELSDDPIEDELECPSCGCTCVEIKSYDYSCCGCDFEWNKGTDGITECCSIDSPCPKCGSEYMTRFSSEQSDHKFITKCGDCGYRWYAESDVNKHLDRIGDKPIDILRRLERLEDHLGFRQ